MTPGSRPIPRPRMKSASTSLAQPTQLEQIEDLLTFAQSATATGQLIQPESASAVYYYNQVLALDPFDGDALAGLNAVTDMLVERAYRSLEENDTNAASRRSRCCR